MNRQAINLLGGLLVAAIVLLGVVVGVLPRWQEARAAADQRQTVALQNQQQQAAIAALAQQRQQLPQMQTQVDALEQQIPSSPRLDQLIDLTTGLPDGAVLQTFTPGATPTSGSASTTTPSTAAPTDGGFQQLPVTLTIGLRDASDAAAVLDRLRAGPRLLAIDDATLAGGGDAGASGASGATLTVAGRVFLNPGAAS